jgi:aldehyde:ferredoxin oxidoreductase
MGNDVKLYGYVGKIARINLTDKSVEIIPTSKYVPKYIGGRCICNKIFWDEVKPGVKAFDLENKLISCRNKSALHRLLATLSLPFHSLD